jgi:CheY-like chemotaxis protein
VSPNLDANDRENVGMIETAARRAAEVTGSLLSFSRGGLTRFGPLDLRTVITDTLRLFAPAAQPGLHIRLDLPPAAVAVEGDRSQLQQAILNILLNARDAMPGGGNIAILLDIEEGEAVLSIGDDGPGMSDDTRTRIFEPFFTTKPHGSGTGLGMSITYGIVQAHHGRIHVVTAPGAGTTFTIQLPTIAIAGAETTLPPAGKGLVLVVDSDEAVRRATSAALARLGYNVVQASSGEIAIRLISARPERFAAVLLDTTDPDAKAMETHLQLASSHPQLQVIACQPASVEPLVSLSAAHSPLPDTRGLATAIR